MTRATTDGSVDGPMNPAEPLWKPDWPAVRQHMTDWWRGEGLVVSLFAPRNAPAEDIPRPERPPNDQAAWCDPGYRRRFAEWQMVNHHCLCDAFPYFDTQIGPGSLGLFLGAGPHFVDGTVWYEPCIDEPDAWTALDVDLDNAPWLAEHMALIEEGLAHSRGRYLTGIPDLIENIDTLAAMRDNQTILMDLLDRPSWVQARLAEINEAFFKVYDHMFSRLRDPHGGSVFSAFKIWGPGKTAKVQCDFCCMISVKMFREFVQPHMARQCEWLDYSMFHLDGQDAIHQLDPLLEIEHLNAIEFTPQAGRPGGGDPMWYDLYRRIKAGGKSVQAIRLTAAEVIPCIDAVGPEGLFLIAYGDNEDEALKLQERLRTYYPQPAAATPKER